MRKQRGIGMVEILVTLLITAVGIIGITGMQAVSLKNNLSALNRSNAMFLTGTIMDRIRTNENADYKTAFTAGPPASLTSCTAKTDNCTPDQIAALHLSHWKCMMGGYQSDSNCANIIPVMPDATGEITTDANGDYVIEIRWVDRVSFADGARTGGQNVSIQTTLGM